MKVIHNKILPFGKDYYAINLFGIIFAKGPCCAQTLRHEYIHTMQMRELWYLGFYLVYCLEWAYRVLQHRNAFKGYMQISFEREAYACQDIIDYPSRRKRMAWRKYL